MSAEKHLSPEYEYEAIETWRLLLPLTPGARISGATRDRVQKLLGTNRTGVEKVVEGKENADPEAIERIYELLTRTHASAADLLPALDAAAELSVDGTDETLEHLMRDPGSRQARAIAWFYQQHHLDAVPDHRNAFLFINDIDVFRTLNTMIRMREIHEKISKNKDYHNIGTEGTINYPTPPATAVTVTGGTHKIQRGQQQIASLQSRINAAPADRDISKLNEALDREEAKVGTLLAKRDELEGELQKLDQLRQQLPTPHPLSLPADLHEHFTETAISTAWNAHDVTIATNFGETQTHNVTHNLSHWLMNSDARRQADKLHSVYRASRGGRPSGEAVLDDLLALHFDGSIGHLTDDEKKKFYAGMRNIIAGKATGGGTDGGKKPDGSKKPDAGQKKRGVVGKIFYPVTASAKAIWDHFWNKRGPLI